MCVCVWVGGWVGEGVCVCVCLRVGETGRGQRLVVWCCLMTPGLNKDIRCYVSP